MGVCVCVCVCETRTHKSKMPGQDNEIFLSLQKPSLLGADYSYGC
jgi:hypothetical protein